MNVVDSKEPVDPATAEQPKSDMKKPESSNFDDSGYFSIQVLNRALQIWALDLIPIGSTDAQGALEDPTKEVAFICNLQNHWLTLRRFGYRKL